MKELGRKSSQGMGEGEDDPSQELLTVLRKKRNEDRSLK
ncbi:hypothetical protein FOMG_05213 [Fusarium oxysporum f. sp. melonis 26406]|uniref:Uncharacterized protein n=1 Tax=Fusarium oxysporum f. sp. melonis 26406 TaxID=1089452 RepID=X0BAI3_FUSOX|nr:hypothetical protein FOMG_05213 [Fusarium oxysporum f. sp. melonis 26406]